MAAECSLLTVAVQHIDQIKETSREDISRVITLLFKVVCLVEDYKCIRDRLDDNDLSLFKQLREKAFKIISRWNNNKIISIARSINPFSSSDNKQDQKKQIELLTKNYLTFQLSFFNDAKEAISEPKMLSICKEDKLLNGINRHFNYVLVVRQLINIHYLLRTSYPKENFYLHSNIRSLTDKLLEMAAHLAGGQNLSADSFLEFVDFLQIYTHWRRELSEARKQCALLVNALLPFVDSVETITRLNLSDFHLKELPPNLRLCSGLIHLNFDENNVQELPEWLEQMTNLEVLSMARNRLEKIPPNLLISLQHLEELDISGNKLSDIPKFVHCSPMQKLNLSCNNLTHIPSNVLELSTLKTLDVSFNLISALPDNFQALTDTLQNLWIHANPLVSLESVVLLVKLQSLNCSHTELRALPKEIQSIFLTELRCNHNHLKSLFELEEDAPLCRSLNLLDLSDNALSSIPLSWRNLCSIERLYLQNNKLVQIPETFASKCLIAVNLSNNRLTSLGAFIYKTQNVWAPKNRIKQLMPVPPNCSWETLSLLNVASNCLENISEDILFKLNISLLTLAFNPLKSLADQLTSYGSLQHLNVMGTNLDLGLVKSLIDTLTELHKRNLGKRGDASDRSLKGSMSDEITLRKRRCELTLLSNVSRSISDLGYRSADIWNTLSPVVDERANLKKYAMSLSGPILLSDLRAETVAHLSSFFGWKQACLVKSDEDKQHFESDYCQTTGGMPYQQDGLCLAVKESTATDWTACLHHILQSMDSVLKNPSLQYDGESVYGTGAMAAVAVLHDGLFYYCHAGDTCAMSIGANVIQRAIEGKDFKYNSKNFTYTRPQSWLEIGQLRMAGQSGAKLHLEKDREPRCDSMPTFSKLGDAYYPHVGCSPSPVVKLSAKHHPLMILATDGLWDVIEPKEIVKIIHTVIQQGGATSHERLEKLPRLLQNAMAKLALLAFSRSFQPGESDNITIAYLLHKKKTKRASCLSVIDGHDKMRREKFVKLLEKTAEDCFLSFSG